MYIICDHIYICHIVILYIHIHILYTYNYRYFIFSMYSNYTIYTYIMTMTNDYCYYSSNCHYTRACSKSSSRVCTRAFLRSPKLRVAQAVARSRLLENKEQTNNKQLYTLYHTILFFAVDVLGNLMNLHGMTYTCKRSLEVRGLRRCLKILNIQKAQVLSRCQAVDVDSGWPSCPSVPCFSTALVQTTSEHSASTTKDLNGTLVNRENIWKYYVTEYHSRTAITICHSKSWPCSDAKLEETRVNKRLLDQQ